jgi:hypothetical protein
VKRRADTERPEIPTWVLRGNGFPPPAREWAEANGYGKLEVLLAINANRQKDRR